MGTLVAVALPVLRKAGFQDFEAREMVPQVGLGEVVGRTPRLALVGALLHHLPLTAGRLLLGEDGEEGHPSRPEPVGAFLHDGQPVGGAEKMEQVEPEDGVIEVFAEGHVENRAAEVDDA